jgi:hypothetical protein
MADGSPANQLENLSDMVLQIVQISLALPIVAAYGLVQFGVIRLDDLSYPVTNLVSSAGLAATAILTVQLGFVITNVLWVAVSAAGLRGLVQRHADQDREAAG